MRNFRISKRHPVIWCAMFVAGLLTAVDAASRPTILQPPQTITISAGELSDHPDRYYGKRVKLTGEVEDVYSRSVFSIDEDRLWSSGSDVLVVNPDAMRRVNQDRTVTVQGVVRPFSHADIDRYIVRHGWQWDLASVFHVRFAKRPIVIADSIMTADSRELVAHGEAIRESAGQYHQPMIGDPSAALTSVIYTTPEELS